MSSEIDLTVVIPCLNEAETLAACIQKAKAGLAGTGLRGEIIVADNGSTDGSVLIAIKEGARVVSVEPKGYGNALMGGIQAARGKYVIMGDADESYDFLEIPRFAEKLKEGYDLVQGCRLPSGGGRIMEGAMPFSHRWIGNPLFSLLARHWFKAPIHDVYCGLRGFRKELHERLNPRCAGMEFATEMIIKASLHGAKITEVPITLHRDGRKTGRSHLKTVEDGWRTLRLLMVFSPRWLFLVPGGLLLLFGLLGYALALPGVRVMQVTFDAHTLLFASLGIICGYQSVLFAVLTKTFAIHEGLLPADPRMTQFFKLLNLERALVLALAGLVLGLVLLLMAVNQWRLAGFGPLEYSRTMRLVVPGAMFTVLGFQTILSSFFVSLLGMRRR